MLYHNAREYQKRLFGRQTMDAEKAWALPLPRRSK